jgi:hypothetical protein
MNRINEVLANIGCGITDLPKPFQERIESIKKLVSQVDEAQKEYDENPTEEEKEKLDDIGNFYEDFVLETCDMIETWNEDVNEIVKQSPKTGLIAQEVQEVLPEVVVERVDGYLGLDYSKMMGLMVEAIKEQQRQIEELKSRL